jgi:Rod binding domain-containing protein
MALTASDKKEIEVLIRKEIKDFFDSSTSKQFENKLMDKISQEIKKGKLKGNVKEVILKSFQEYFTVMYQQRGFWEQKFRNV